MYILRQTSTELTTQPSPQVPSECFPSIQSKELVTGMLQEPKVVGATANPNKATYATPASITSRLTESGEFNRFTSNRDTVERNEIRRNA